jgi:hypothetical protein
MARPPKYDYDDDKFYLDIFEAAVRGLNDAEIADEMNLTPAAFYCMKNGNYDKWSEEENARRSERLVNVLAHGRRKTNSIVRGAYLKAALGGKKVKDVSTTTRKLRDNNGNLTDTEEVSTTTVERELPPNMQALATWLYHHDEEWRKIQKGEDDSDIPQNVVDGIPIDEWIKEKMK